MILTRNEIEKEIVAGRIKISPYNKNNLGPASYDLSVADEFIVFDDKIIKVNDKTEYKKYGKKIKTKRLTLGPGDFAVAITNEKITLPDNICAWLGGRSRFARVGLQIHITAAFIQPGVSNRQALELYNASRNTLIIEAGTKIAQIVFERTEGKAHYSGKFKRQLSL
ncbi:MAG: dCTP deaminase [Candidatus Woesearchaeota archaeon]